MNWKLASLSWICILVLFISMPEVIACSMYKVTHKGKTVVGCNEDAWRTTSSIWFKNATKKGEFGIAFTGSRIVSDGRTAPQSGMNMAGLSFSRLAAYYPKQENPFKDRKKVKNEVDYLSGILHQCSSIEEVKNFINSYDHSYFFEDVFIYIDSSGKYLVVEPYHLIEGDDPNYVLSNFCPSITTSESARNIERYRNGTDFLKYHNPNSSPNFFRELSDTMHVCRERNGDGTLLTSIWDTKEKTVTLYFYHDFEKSVLFDLKDELAKGDHSLNAPDLFPQNPEFEQLKAYITPFNLPNLRIAMVLLGGFLTLISLILVVLWVRSRDGTAKKTSIFIALINLLLTAYLAVLVTNKYIFYFDAPFVHSSSKLITLSSYLPFLLLLIILPFSFFNIKYLKVKNIDTISKTLLISSNAIYLALIVAFGYWGFYNIW